MSHYAALANNQNGDHTMAIPPALTDEERSILRSLENDGSSLQDLWPPSAHGRLALYGLVDETPHGWVITPYGKDAIDRAPARPTPAARTRGIRRDGAGKRLPTRRDSPIAP